MNSVSALLTLDNPVFQTYIIAASIMILKLMFQPWMTVVRMMKVGAGFRAFARSAGSGAPCRSS